MKKVLLLLASAALLIVSCNKEQTAENVAGDGLQTVSFTVGVESIATRAVDDNDGKAVNINQWVIQVMDSDGGVYHHKAESGELGNTTHTFNVPLVKGQTYNILFWADTKDSYVVTDLRQVKRSEKTYLKANADSLDAFSAVVKDFSTTVASKKDITLKRPFAQLNVVFTDLKKLYETMNNADEYAKFKPVDFVAKAKVPTEFNVLTQEAGAPAETALVMTAAKDYLGNYTSHRAKEALYMDYIFASKDTKDVVDIDFSFVSKGVSIAHNFTSIPFQRNFRTNILGEFMSAGAQWNVEVDPTWDSFNDGSKDINVDYREVNKTSEVADAIQSKTNDSDPAKEGQGLSITINDEVGPDNDDIIIPDNTPKAKTPEIILDFKKLSANAQIVIRDENHPRDAQEATYGANEYPGEVIVIVPEGTTAEQVKILTNKSTVTVRGAYGTVIASCAPQTIIVEKETVIGTLEVMKGNVEVYGKVTSIVNKTAEAPAEQDVVYVYLFQGSTWTNVNNDKSEKLVPLYPVAKIGEDYYFNLVEALAAVKKGDVLTLTSDLTLSEKLLINGGKDFTLDLGGKTLTGRVNVDGAKLVVKNGKIDAGSFAQALNVYGSKDPQYKDGIYTYVKVESDVTLDGSTCALGVLPVYGETYYPLSYGVKVDFYGKAYNVPAQVIGNLGFDNYKSNIGNVDISANLPAGITAPSKAMSLYGPIVNIYGEMKSTSVEEECQAFILSGMARVNVYEGAYLEGSEGFAMKSGNLHVYGGTIKSNGEKKDPVQAVNSGSEASGAAISITSYYTHDMFEDRAKIQVSIEGGDIQAVNNAALLVTHSYKDSKPVALKQGVDLAISGGKFTSGSGIPVVFIDNAAEGDAFAMPSKFISGGLYNKAPEAGYIIDGKSAVKNAQGYYELKEVNVTPVGENGVESIISYDGSDEKIAIVYAAENTVIPHGVTDLQSDDELMNAPGRNYDKDWPFVQNQTVKSVWIPSTILVKENGKQDFNGAFQHCDNLESITLEGGNDMIYTSFPMIAWCKSIKTVKIDRLPTDFKFQYGVNDNSAVNTRFIYDDGAGMPGAVIKVYLPNGWKNSGYQYKFGAQMDKGIPTIEVYEADPEGNYQLLGKTVNNVWQDPE